MIIQGLRVSVQILEFLCILNLSELKILRSVLLSFMAILSEPWIVNKFNSFNDPKFSDRLVWANSADPDQTAPKGAV